MEQIIQFLIKKQNERLLKEIAIATDLDEEYLFQKYFTDSYNMIISDDSKVYAVNFIENNKNTNKNTKYREKTEKKTQKVE